MKSEYGKVDIVFMSMIIVLNAKYVRVISATIAI